MIVGRKRGLGTQRLGLEWPLSEGGTGSNSGAVLAHTSVFGHAFLVRRPRKTHTPDDACRRVKELKAITGGAVSYAPPPTPEPSTTSRTDWGGEPANVGTLGLTPAATESVLRADSG